MLHLEKKKLQKGAVKDVLRVMWRHASRYWAACFCIILAIVGISIINIIVPLYYKELVDAVSESGGVEEIMSKLFRFFSIILGLRIFTWVLRRVRGFTNTYFESRIMADLSQASFDYLIRHSYSFFSDNFAGSLVRKVNRLSRSFEDIFDQLTFNLLPLVFTVAGILWVLFRRDFLLGAILSAGVFIFLVFNIAVTRWKQKYEIAKTEKDSELTGALADAIANTSTIKLFTGYKHESGLFSKVNNELRGRRFFIWNLSEGMDAFQAFMMLSVEMGMIYAAIVLWGRGVLTAGDFVLIQAYLINIFDRVFDFGRALRRLFEAFADGAEMVDILNTPFGIKDIPNAKPLIAEKGDIEFQKVDFSFHKTRKVLDDFSLKIKSGEKVALVGSSGAGKSTIIRLLCRFHDVASGKIFIDGQNIAKVTQESLWSAVSLVPQEPILFHRTLKENILYGRRDAKDEDMIDAAKKANCHEFISALPYGYETYVGERGVKLSGGERQRVAIARAILKNAPILVLDEATSSLDSESEQLIHGALQELMKGRTVIAIAHRLSTIRQMDRIVVVEDGNITAIGAHDDLLRKGGTYKKLWNIQAGNFI